MDPPPGRRPGGPNHVLPINFLFMRRFVPVLNFLHHTLALLLVFRQQVDRVIVDALLGQGIRIDIGFRHIFAVGVPGVRACFDVIVYKCLSFMGEQPVHEQLRCVGMGRTVINVDRLCGRPS